MRNSLSNSAYGETYDLHLASHSAKSPVAPLVPTPPSNSTQMNTQTNPDSQEKPIGDSAPKSSNARSIVHSLTMQRMMLHGVEGQSSKYSEHFAEVLRENPTLAEQLKKGAVNTLSDLLTPALDNSAGIVERREKLLKLTDERMKRNSLPGHVIGHKEYATTFKQICAEHPELV